MIQDPRIVLLRPPSEEDLTIRAEKWLRAAGVWGQLPTPIEPLYQAARVVERDMLELVEEPGFSTALENAEDSVRNAWQKILGIADLRKKVVYINRNSTRHRRRFTQ